MEHIEKEFFTELKKKCNIHGIDIDILCDEEIQLIYNGTTFDVQCCEYDGKLEVPISIVSMSIKGKDYDYDVYSFVDIDFTDTYNTVNEAVEDVIDIVLNNDDRRKVLKVINAFESFVEDMSEDDLGVLISYIKNQYD
jgi:hypothetical protein